MELITNLMMVSRCDNCNRIMEEDEHNHIVDEILNWCCECYHKVYFFCDGCEDDIPLDDKKVIGNEWFCPDCYNVFKEEDT